MTRQMITIASTLMATLLGASVVQAQTAIPVNHKTKHAKKAADKLAKKSAKKSAKKTTPQRVAVNFVNPAAAPQTAAQRAQALAKASPGRGAVPSMSQQQQPPAEAPFVSQVNEKWVANPPQPHPLPKTAPKRPAIVVQPRPVAKTSPSTYAQNGYQSPAATAAPYDTAPDLDAQEGMLRASTQYRNPAPHRDFTIIPFAAGGYSTFQLNGNNNSATSNQTNTGTFGYAGGLLAEMEWGHVGMQTGLVYMVENNKVQMNAVNTDGSRDLVQGTEAVSYLGIPILGKLTTGRHGEVRFSAKAGVIPVFEVSGSKDLSTQRTFADGQVLTGSDSGSSSDTLRSVNAIAQAGVGIEIPIADLVDLRIEGVYNRSLMSIENDSVGTRTYSQSFQGIVGIGVGI